MNDFNFSDAFLGRQGSKKDFETMREIQRHANDILRLVNMPNGDPVNTFAADILRSVRAIEQLVGPTSAKMIDWSKLVADIKNDPDVDKFWDRATQTYRKNPGGAIDWMASLKDKPAKQETKKSNDSDSVGKLFKL